MKKGNVFIMTTNTILEQSVNCLVCNKTTQKNPVNVYSCLSKESDTIHSQISGIVGLESVLEAVKSSETICSLCFKLLLNIYNIEVELKILKSEFLGVFQQGVYSRKWVGEKDVTIEVQYENPFKCKTIIKTNNEYRTLSNCDEKPNLQSSHTKSESNLHNLKTFVNHNKEDHPVNKNSFSDKYSQIVGKQNGFSCQTNSNELQSHKNEDLQEKSLQTPSINASLQIGPHEIDHGISHKTISYQVPIFNQISQHEIDYGFSHKTTSDQVPIFKQKNKNRSVENKPMQNSILNQNGSSNLISVINIKNRKTQEEELCGFDFDNFETSLCATDGDAEKSSVRASNRIATKLKRVSKSKETPEKKSTSSKKIKNDSFYIGDSFQDTGEDLDFDDDEVHHDCNKEGHTKESCNACKNRRCKICDRVFSKASEIGEHRIRVHRDIYKYVCNKCPSICYKNKEKLTQHLRLCHKANVHQCPGCDVEETSQNALDQHIINKHPDSRFFECKICHKSFRTYRYLNVAHIKRAHVGLPIKYYCDKCQKGFASKSSLENHKYTHSDVRNYKCEFCEARFHTPYSLKVHTNTHTKEKKYPCPTCGVTFLRLCNLIGHKQSHCLRDKRFVCEFCGTMLNTNRDLIIHQTVCHKNEKSFRCEICNKDFADKRNMNEHFLLQHMQEKPYKCHCGKSFLNSHRLRYHQRFTHNVNMPDQEVTSDNGIVEESTKTFEDNEEESMVVITVKECSSPLYSVSSVDSVPSQTHKVILANDQARQVENNSLPQSLLNSQDVNLPLLHSTFGAAQTPSLLFAPLNLNPLDGTMDHHAREVIQQGMNSKIDHSITQLTQGVNSKLDHSIAQLTQEVNTKLDPSIAQLTQGVNTKLDPSIAQITQEVNSKLDPSIAQLAQEVNSKLDPSIAQLTQGVNSIAQLTQGVNSIVQLTQGVNSIAQLTQEASPKLDPSIAQLTQEVNSKLDHSVTQGVNSKLEHSIAQLTQGVNSKLDRSIAQLTQGGNSKLDPTIAQLTDSIQRSFPFIPDPRMSVPDTQNHLETRSLTPTPLPAELLELPHLHTNNQNGVPVAYITAWPS